MTKRGFSKAFRKKMTCAMMSATLVAAPVVGAYAAEEETTGAAETDQSESESETQSTTTDETDGSEMGTASDGTAASDGSEMGTPPDGTDGSEMGTPPDGTGGSDSTGGTSSGVSSYDAVESVTTDTTFDGVTLSSTGTDENVVDVSNNATASIVNSTVSRVSEDSTGGDNSSFYGVGAALLARSGKLLVTNTTINTDANGAAGIFAYSDGVAYISNSTITTTKNTAGGIHAAGGGTLYAWDLDVTTSGGSSAAIRSDRGGGTMVVDGGTYTSNGTGSPAIYCTADITVNDADLTANGSEAFCLEGLNTTRLYNCNLTGNMADDSQNETTWNVILYQSMSGDAETGNSTFDMQGGSLTANNGGMFYTTNTESTFILSDVDITYAEDSEYFLRCTGNTNQRGWGSTGSNGADCNFTGIDQTMVGNVIWDSISTLDFYITSGSSLTGALVQDESCAGTGGTGYANVYVSEDSSWIVTGDSTVTNLYAESTIKDADGNTVSIVGTDGTAYVTGDSAYTITVSSYSASADFSGASSTTSWSTYAVDKPAELIALENEAAESQVASLDTDETVSSDSDDATDSSDSDEAEASDSSESTDSEETETTEDTDDSEDSEDAEDSTPQTGDNSFNQAKVLIGAGAASVLVLFGAAYEIERKKKRN